MRIPILYHSSITMYPLFTEDDLPILHGQYYDYLLLGHARCQGMVFLVFFLNLEPVRFIDTLEGNKKWF